MAESALRKLLRHRNMPNKDLTGKTSLFFSLFSPSNPEDRQASTAAAPFEEAVICLKHAASDARRRVHSPPRPRSAAPSDSSYDTCGAPPLSACCRQSPGVIPIR